MDIVRPASKQPIPPDAKKVFEGVLFDAYQWEQQMFDGSTVTFERLRRPDTVVVFPVLPDGTILLAKQEQPGRSDVFTSGLGGRMEAGESPLDAAKRELREESGYEAQEFVLWDAQQPVNKLDWAVYTFIAKGTQKAGEQQLDSGERVELMPVSFDAFIELGAQPEFGEREIVRHIIEAKWNPAKRAELEKFFSPMV